MSLAIGVVGLVLAIIDVYFPSTKARIERFLGLDPPSAREAVPTGSCIALCSAAFQEVGS